MSQETSPLRVLPPAHDPEHMWHVTLTVAGKAQEAETVLSCLQRLSERHPFLMDARYATDRAEIRYWEEAENLATAIDLASRVWQMNAEAAGLPGWHVVASRWSSGPRCVIAVSVMPACAWREDGSPRCSPVGFPRG